MTSNLSRYLPFVCGAALSLALQPAATTRPQAPPAQPSTSETPREGEDAAPEHSLHHLRANSAGRRLLR